MKKLILPGILFTTLSAGAQLYIDNATFFIDNGAVVTVQGDVFSNVNIQAAGTGKLRMGGSANQNLNMNGNTVPNLQIDNSAASVVLTGAAKVSGMLEFTTGKMQLGNFDFTLASTGSHTGAAAGKFAETNGTGTFKQELTLAGTKTVPVGNGATYTPLSYQSTGGVYNAGAFLGVRSVATAHPNKHPRSTDFLNSYWKLTNGNITGATMSAVGTYVDPTSVTGVEADLRAMNWDGANWALGTAQDVAANSVTAAITASGQDLYGMNKFILSSPKVFLQGAFNAGTGLMTDRLRNSTGAYTPGVLPGSIAMPTSDPYRVAPYNGFFTHVANTVTETISTDVLKDLASPENQIVDWVFVELRNKVSNSQATVVQTRSALIQRDGDVVDIDGVSPIYFKNVDAGSNWVISVRHRNHLGISSNPTNALALGLATSPFDFTNTANANIFGISGTNYTTGGAPLKNLLWAGNGRNNTLANWSGLNNDKDYLYQTVLGSNSATSVAGYSAGDYNLNRTANWSGLNNDKDFLYQQVLSSNSAISRTQALPN
jgi:hypothetical protein